ncbi:SprT-like domain-containing protein [Corallincola platygyrae]|uniref:SprT-like domain-containing protein n=1 Tax=Corallincola platygyrae TaxID=1193278 RepID=A0ABW4XJE0_9GAMM
MGQLLTRHLQRIIYKKIREAETAFCVQFPHITISFDLKGRAAGKVEYRCTLFGKMKQAHLRLNLDAYHLDKNFIESEVVPHEVAHLVCALLYPRKSEVKPHGVEWKEICQILGGSGKATHALPLKKKFQQRKWLYRDSHGKEHSVSTTRHKRLQNGVQYHTRTLASITKEGFIRQHISVDE